MRRGVLIVDETGDPKRGHRIVLAAQQYLGKLGHVANGVVAVTSHWTDGSRHVPLGVKPYRPASRLPKGRKDPAFHTKPALAWQLIAEARAAGIPFRLVVADSVYGENATLEAQLFAAQNPLRDGPAALAWPLAGGRRRGVIRPPSRPPRRRSACPRTAWQRTVRSDSHGKELVRYVAELELGMAYGPTRGVRLIAATLDPATLTPESTWYLATSLPLAQVSAAQVYEIYRLRDWIEHYYKPVKHELGWADYQLRPERAIVRHWQLVMLAFTFSLLVGALPDGAARDTTPSPADATRECVGWGKIRASGARRGARRVGRDAALGAELALPLGAAAAVLEAVVTRRATARAGRAPRPCRPLPPA